MAEHPNVTLTRESLTAVEKGDMGWLESHMADDIVWHVGGNSKSAGTYKGKETVMGFFAGMNDVSMDLDVHDVLGNDDHAVVLGSAKLSAPDGDSVEYNYVNVFPISDGKVTEVWGMSENDAETDPFWDKLAPPS